VASVGKVGFSPIKIVWEGLNTSTGKGTSVVSLGGRIKALGVNWMGRPEGGFVGGRILIKPGKRRAEFP